MKATITEVKYLKEYDTKYGKMYQYRVKYDDIVAIYNSKSKDQKQFIPDKEAEFTEESKSYTDQQGNIHEYIVIKPLNQNRQSNFGKALKKEQTRYSGFAVSYAKDMAIAGLISKEDLPEYATVLFDLMVNLDKSIES
jgi:hypothetical protein